ncbi:MAG TPA: F0F1 ATP synthase subunit A [Chloroflexia bacterium]|nr:F0F1 ATP synthase subunit A [Chloroflexia bacterium]
MEIDLGTKLPPISIKAETLVNLFGIAFTNSMLYTLIVVAGLALFFWLATRRMKLVPSGIQNFAEAIVELLLGITEGTAGRRVGRRIFPLIATLFIFILTANYAGLLPGVGTIGYCTEHHTAPGAETEHTLVIQKDNAQIVSVPGLAAPILQEEEHPAEDAQPAEEAKSGLPTDICKQEGKEEFIPFLRAPNADLNTTLAMALLAVGIVQIAGIAAHGVGGYIKELTTPIFLAPLHIIGEISRVISLSFRLFGNIFGGEVLVTVMYALLGSLFLGFGAFIFLGVELLFGLIQALIFSILTLVYISTAVAGHAGGPGHGGGHGEAHTGDHAAPTGEMEELGHEIAHKLTGQDRSGDTGVEVPGTEPKSGTERHMG